jgi:hypothetical protein
VTLPSEVQTFVTGSARHSVADCISCQRPSNVDSNGTECPGQARRRRRESTRLALAPSIYRVLALTGDEVAALLDVGAVVPGVDGRLMAIPGHVPPRKAHR